MWIWPDRSASMQFASPLGPRHQALPRAGRDTGARRSAGRRRRTRRHSRSDASDRQPQCHRTDRAGDRARSHRARRACRRTFAPSPLAEVVLLSDLWSDIGDVRRTLTQLSGNGAHGHVVQIVDPAEETFPYWGRIEFVEPEGGGRITAGRAETWRADYTARVARHRAEIRARDRPARLELCHPPHRPSGERAFARAARAHRRRHGT